MSKKFGFLKSGLMGSSTMPLGTGGAPVNLFPTHSHHHHHEHAADGSCCGHDHHHAEEEHVHDENCGHNHK